MLPSPDGMATGCKHSGDKPVGYVSLPRVKVDLPQAVDRTFDGLSVGHPLRCQHPFQSLPFGIAAP